MDDNSRSPKWLDGRRRRDDEMACDAESQRTDALASFE
jgi:hypothetical protein